MLGEEYMVKVALAMIVKGSKDEAPLLENCLKNISKHVDGIYLDINSPKGKGINQKVLDIAKKYKADVKQTVWEGNFVKARNDNFNRVPKDFTHILWLDSDDTVENPEKIREVAAITDSVDGIYIKYDYAHDEYGNVTVTHWVARLIKNNNSFAWKSSFADMEVTVHETLNERRKVKKAMNDEFWIVHHASEERRDASLTRNIELLEGMLDEYGRVETADPRILYYLATHYIDAYRYPDAKQLFEEYLRLSGWAEERSQAWVYLGMIYQAYSDTAKARGCYMRALAENPDDPNPYVELGELEINDRLYQKAVTWLEMAVNKKIDHTAMVQRPMDSTYRAYKLLSQAYVNIGGKSLQKARKWLTEAQKLRPFDPELADAHKVLDELVEVRDSTKAVDRLIKKLSEAKETDKIPALCDSLPESMQDNPLVVSARNYYRKPIKHPNKSIAILCGWGPLGNWGPSGLEKGIGGSEEAVIRISRELAKLGYKVTVYGTPGEEAGMDGDVEYRHYWDFNRKDEFDIFISWRNPEFFEEPVKARKSYLWLHDVMDTEEFTDTRLKNIDRIIFVSQYHRDLYPFISEDKCFVSGNGISPEEFEALDGKIERDPHKVIYMSSHVRGLEMVYKVWPDVIKEIPDASLDIYYGWGSYVAVNKDNPERMQWKEYMEKLANDLPNVTDHGKVGHQTINEEIFRSGVWAYPCPFPEVYCHPAGTKVMTEFGEKNIEEITLQDKVLTHGTNIKPIYQTMRRKAKELIQLKVRSGDDLLLTPNHPVYVKRNGKYEWVEADELTTDDRLLTPADISDYKYTDGNVFQIKDNNIYRVNNLPTSDHKMPEHLEITPEFAKFLGYFAGDGNANERGKVSVLVADKHPEHEKTVLDGFKHIGLKPDIAQKSGCKEYRVYNYELARAFRRFFYDGKKKQLPLWLASYPETLDGLLEADGHVKNGYNYNFTNTSDRLIGWTKIALAIKGFSGKVQERMHKNGNTSWTISWTQEGKLPQYHKIGGFIEKKIKSIDRVEHNDWVYNIEVEDDHSYVSNGSVVHNCITAVKAQAGGAIPVSSNFAALDETIKYGVKIAMKKADTKKTKDDEANVGSWTDDELNQFKSSLIDMLKNPDKQNKIRPDMMAWARKEMSWAKTAKGWQDDFES